MDFSPAEQCCDADCIPAIYPMHVLHKGHDLWRITNYIYNVNYSSDGYLDILSPLDLSRILYCTFSYSSLKRLEGISFFLNVKSLSNFRARSRSSERDKAICDCISESSTSNNCPAGNIGRVISDSFVTFLRLFDRACKACTIVRRRTLKRFIAWAMNSLRGSFDFRWGEKSSRIFEWLSQIKNRTSHSYAGAYSLLYATWVAHSPKKPLRMNALRVAECNFTKERYE